MPAQIRFRERPANCDRYGHPRDTQWNAESWQRLTAFVRADPEGLHHRWAQLFRALYDDPEESSPSNEVLHQIMENLVDAIGRENGSLMQCDALLQNPEALRLVGRICRAGWECPGYLMPFQDWETRHDLESARGLLRHRLAEFAMAASTD